MSLEANPFLDFQVEAEDENDSFDNFSLKGEGLHSPTKIFESTTMVTPNQNSAFMRMYELQNSASYHNNVIESQKPKLQIFDFSDNSTQISKLP